ncbi:MAG: hypothetical protein M1827_001543 [Pycnora praestabilis]|nr:MAG: hypothetical protein M1827_001543 [Pycnora praestabilis]
MTPSSTTTTKPSPFAPSTSIPGHGTINIALLPPSTPTLHTLSYQYPLKLISPDPTTLSSGQKVILAFLLTYGGGLVAGDNINLTINLAAHTRLGLVTQGSTKIFKAPSRDVVSRQIVKVKIANGAALCYLPDPIQPFRESCYEQRQCFGVEKGASLCVLDWVSEGRRARGERWSFWEWRGRNEVWSWSQAGEGEEKGRSRLLLRDNVILDTSAEGFSEGLAGRMDELGVFGTLIIRGPVFADLGEYFKTEFSSLPRIGARSWSTSTEIPQLSVEEGRRAARQKKEKEDGVLWTAAAVRGLVLVKFGAKEVEGAKNWLGSMLRAEGTVQREFGDGALLCLR